MGRGHQKTGRGKLERLDTRNFRTEKPPTSKLGVHSPKALGSTTLYHIFGGAPQAKSTSQINPGPAFAGTRSQCSPLSLAAVRLILWRLILWRPTGREGRHLPRRKPHCTASETLRKAKGWFPEIMLLAPPVQGAYLTRPAQKLGRRPLERSRSNPPNEETRAPPHRLSSHRQRYTRLRFAASVLRATLTKPFCTTQAFPQFWGAFLTQPPRLHPRLSFGFQLMDNNSTVSLASEWTSHPLGFQPRRNKQDPLGSNYTVCSGERVATSPPLTEVTCGRPHADKHRPRKPIDENTSKNDHR